MMEVKSDLCSSRRIKYHNHKNWIFSQSHGKLSSHYEDSQTDEDLTDAIAHSDNLSNVSMGTCCSVRKELDSETSSKHACTLASSSQSFIVETEDKDTKDTNPVTTQSSSSVQEKIRHFNNRISNKAHTPKAGIQKQASLPVLSGEPMASAIENIDNENKCDGTANNAPNSIISQRKVKDQHQHQAELPSTGPLLCHQCRSDINVKQDSPNSGERGSRTTACVDSSVNDTIQMANKEEDIGQNDEKSLDKIVDKSQHLENSRNETEITEMADRNSQEDITEGVSLYTRRTGQQLSALMDSTPSLEQYKSKPLPSSGSETLEGLNDCNNEAPLDKVMDNPLLTSLGHQTRKTALVGFSKDLGDRGKRSLGKPVLKKRHSEPTSASSLQGNYTSLDSRTKGGKLRRKTCVVHLDGCRFTIGKACSHCND